MNETQFLYISLLSLGFPLFIGVLFNELKILELLKNNRKKTGWEMLNRWV
jgi:hypothetical protein